MSAAAVITIVLVIVFFFLVGGTVGLLAVIAISASKAEPVTEPGHDQKGTDPDTVLAGGSPGRTSGSRFSSSRSSRLVVLYSMSEIAGESRT